jgi:catechol 2,3-dioxygenase-like lactoylglutathione lyase family enzyme
MDKSLYSAAITFLPVADLLRSTVLYRDILGLPIALDQGGIRIFRVAAGGFFGLVEKTDEPIVPDQRIMLTLVTDDVDGIFGRLAGAGIAVDDLPRENPRYRIYHFFAVDPDGYRLEVQRFLHPFG